MVRASSAGGLLTAMFRLTLSLILLTAVVGAQTGRGGGLGRGPATAAPLTSTPPIVHVDRTVTLRLRAPQAASVDLVGELTQKGLNSAVPMTKGDDGVWTVTIGPIPPEIWRYAFRVGGVQAEPAMVRTKIGN